MSYIKWRHDHEKKTLEIINDGALETLSGWKESCHNKMTDTVITPLVDEMLRDTRMIPINIACLFAQYFHEEYNVAPSDIEFFSQAIIKAELRQVERHAAQVTPIAMLTAICMIRDAMPGDVPPSVNETLNSVEEQIKLSFKE